MVNIYALSVLKTPDHCTTIIKTIFHCFLWLFATSITASVINAGLFGKESDCNVFKTSAFR